MEEALREHQVGAILSVRPLSGGCINQATCVDAERGRVLLKWNSDAPLAFFEAEADGLGALARAVEASGAPMAVPHPIAHGGTDSGAWLLTVFVESGVPTVRTFERLGRGMALIHGEAATAGRDPIQPGWPRDNWIGALPQANGRPSLPSRHADDEPSPWATFWSERRLRVQLLLARESGCCRSEAFDAVFDVVPAALPAGLPLGLLHGDLWSGNYMTREDGVPTLIDPSVYIGHGEVDLAMTELFGGFGLPFQDAYGSVRPITVEYQAFRRDLYQLYYLLVHVNLFGRSYETASERAAIQVVRALS